MPAFIQAVDFLIRFGPAAHQYGDPYRNTVGVLDLKEGVCELLGYAVEGDESRRASKSDYREIFALLNDMAFHSAIVRHRKEGRTIVKEYDTATGRVRRASHES